MACILQRPVPIRGFRCISRPVLTLYACVHAFRLCVQSPAWNILFPRDGVMRHVPAVHDRGVTERTV